MAYSKRIFFNYDVVFDGLVFDLVRKENTGSNSNEDWAYASRISWGDAAIGRCNKAVSYTHLRAHET